MNNETPDYIKTLLVPNGKKPQGRKVWSIDLESVWLPFFTATNTVGDTRLPADSLGCPLRLGYELDGTVKFSRTGRPVIKVAKELADTIRLVKENFTATLTNFASGVIADKPDGYKAQVEVARKAGEPILLKDRGNLQEALAVLVAKAEAEAEAEAKAQLTVEPVVEPVVEPATESGKPHKEKVAVTA